MPAGAAGRDTCGPQPEAEAEGGMPQYGETGGGFPRGGWLWL